VLAGAAVVTLTFGIGLNTGAFAVVAGLVFRARVATHPETFFQVIPDGGGPFGSSLDDFNRWRTLTRSAGSLSAWAVGGARVNGDSGATLVQMVSCSYFELYGLERTVFGRTFGQADCAAPSPVMVLSEELWRGRFHADRQIVGARVSLSGRAYTVVGVVPDGFSGRLRGPGIWVPYTMQAQFYEGLDLFGQSGRPWLTVEGRLLPPHSRSSTAGEFGPGVSLTNGSLIEMPAARTAALFAAPLFMGAITLLLLLACTNVTVLLLSRAAARRYEMSVRLALGAGRGRLLRMAATEGILLAAIAGGAAAFVAPLVPAAVRALVPAMPYYPMQVDWAAFAWLAGITLAAGCVAGMAPAAESLRGELSGSLKRQQTVVAAGRVRWKLRDLLIAAQIAASVVLLAGAVLFARAQYRLLTRDQTGEARQVMVVPLSRGAYERAAPLVRTLPGVRAVEFAPGASSPARGSLEARFDGDPAAFALTLRESLAGLGLEPRDLPATLDAVSGEAARRFGSVAVVALFLGFSALVLSITGVYGVVAFAVTQRTREIGIRLAIGATRGDILRAVIGSAVRPLIAGLLCGLPLAMLGACMLGRALRRSPAPISAMDPAVFAGVTAFVVLAAVAAMLRPALRASRWDPMRSLCQE
jgi:hypothetical protein